MKHGNSKRLCNIEKARVLREEWMGERAVVCLEKTLGFRPGSWEQAATPTGLCVSKQVFTHSSEYQTSKLER